VKLTAVTPRGSYQPAGGSGISLPGGSAVGIPLPSLGGIPAALQISSDVPVTAAVMAPGGEAGAPGAFTAAASPVLEQGVVARDPGSGIGSTTLVLSAPGAAASVLVAEATSTAGFAAHPGRLVQLAAGHTVALRLHPPAGSARRAAFAVLVIPQPGSGPVYAARVVSSGGAVRSILPVASSLIRISLPTVRDALMTALP
jgi:hypothetical protein